MATLPVAYREAPIIPDVRTRALTLHAEALAAEQADTGHYEGMPGGYVEVHHTDLKALVLWALAGMRAVSRSEVVRAAVLRESERECDDWATGRSQG